MSGLKDFVTDQLEEKGMLGRPGNSLGTLLSYEEALLPYFGLADEEAVWAFARRNWKELEVHRLEDTALVDILAVTPGCDLLKAMVRIGLEKTIILMEEEVNQNGM